MSAATRALVVVLLAGALSFAPGPGATSPGGRAAAADCAWQRHSKRVVRQVKSHGRQRRQVRIKHWWSCTPLPPPAAAAVPAPAPGPATAPPAPTTPEAKLEWLNVKAKEWSLTLSRPSVPAGEVMVELSNEGSDPHDLNLQREGGAEPPLRVAETDPGALRSGRFTLPAGTYQLWCSLPGHKEQGMSVRLEVGSG